MVYYKKCGNIGLPKSNPKTASKNTHSLEGKTTKVNFS
jgi:hypothetical protein